MISNIPQRLIDNFSSALYLNHEIGGAIDEDKIIIEIPSYETRASEYIWTKAYPCIWHTHPIRSNTWEPPSGADIVSAASMSIDLNQVVIGYALEKNGVWKYQVDMTKWRVIMQPPDLLDIFEFVANNYATRLNGNKEELEKKYDKEYRTIISSIDDYITKWRTYFHDYIDIEFFPLI